MKQDNIKFVVTPDALLKALDNAANVISKTQDFLAKHGEGVKDYKLYLTNGVDYKIRERVEATEKYLAETNAPSWLYDGYKQRSVESLGSELLTYYNNLQSYIPMRISVNGATLTLDIDTDVEINNGGKWLPSDALKDKITASYTRILSDAEMEDFHLCQDFLAMYRKLYAKGYDLHNPKHLAAMSSTETLAHAFVSVYSQIIDERIDEKEREQLRLKALGYIK